MQMTYEVRTPFGHDGESFHKAMTRIKREAVDQLSIRAKWLRGRDKKSGRYHFWQIDDRAEALAFMFAYGDQIQEKQNEDSHVDRNEKPVCKEKRDGNASNRNRD